jgi:hypothetical protein
MNHLGQPGFLTVVPAHDTENDALDCVAFHSTILNVLAVVQREEVARSLLGRVQGRRAHAPYQTAIFDVSRRNPVRNPG